MGFFFGGGGGWRGGGGGDWSLFLFFHTQLHDVFHFFPVLVFVCLFLFNFMDFFLFFFSFSFFGFIFFVGCPFFLYLSAIFIYCLVIFLLFVFFVRFLFLSDFVYFLCFYCVSCLFFFGGGLFFSSLFCCFNLTCKQTYDTWRFGHVVSEDIVIVDIADQALDIFLHGPESAHNNGIGKTFTHTSISIQSYVLLRQRPKHSTHQTWRPRLVVLFLSNVVVGDCSTSEVFSPRTVLTENICRCVQQIN